MKKLTGVYLVLVTLTTAFAVRGLFLYASFDEQVAERIRADELASGMVIEMMLGIDMLTCMLLTSLGAGLFIALVIGTELRRLRATGIRSGVEDGSSKVSLVYVGIASVMTEMAILAFLGIRPAHATVSNTFFLVTAVSSGMVLFGTIVGVERHCWHLRRQMATTV